MLRKAGCKVGEVTKAKNRKCKRAGKREAKKCHGKKRRQVVRKSRPKAGSTPADGKVDLKLEHARKRSA